MNSIKTLFFFFFLCSDFSPLPSAIIQSEENKVLKRWSMKWEWKFHDVCVCVFVCKSTNDGKLCEGVENFSNNFHRNWRERENQSSDTHKIFLLQDFYSLTGLTSSLSNLSVNAGSIGSRVAEVRSINILSSELTLTCFIVHQLLSSFKGSIAY